MTNDAQLNDFEAVKKRLEEIADAVDDESLPLDDALDLFEEAVSLGLKVSDYIEEGIVVEDGSVQADQPIVETVDGKLRGGSGGSAPVDGMAENPADGQGQDAGASE